MHWPRALPGTPFLQRVHGSLPHLHQVGHLPRGAFPDRPVYLAPLHVLPTHQASHWQPAVPLSPALMAADATRAAPNASDAEGSLRVPEGRPAPPQSRRPHCGGFSLHLGMLPRGQAPGARGTPGLPRGKGPPAHTKRTRLARGTRQGQSPARPPPGRNAAQAAPAVPLEPQTQCRLGARHALRPLPAKASPPSGVRHSHLCDCAHPLRRDARRSANAPSGHHARPPF